MSDTLSKNSTNLDKQKPNLETIHKHESAVRGYCRSFPTIFDHASGSELFDIDGNRYLDFFAGAGALNYGHNHPVLKEALLDYIESNSITHGLDLATQAKCELLETFHQHILSPRNLDYKVMFTGPTGTNSVEAALKLARKVTGRDQIFSFTNAFHGMTLGSLSITGNKTKRKGAGVPLNHSTRIPFDGYHGQSIDTCDLIENLLNDASSGIEKPAAFILETVQAEGGVHTASAPWLRKIAQIAKKHGALLIIDDIQVGCGRTGPFFSFERAGIEPDIVCLSKSLSGFGLPFALTLFKPEYDQWSPGEHNGTFRGNNHAFVTAKTALETFWTNDSFQKSVIQKSSLIQHKLQSLANETNAEHRGFGMIQGLVFEDPTFAQQISHKCFKQGLIIETAGPKDEVLKLLPPLIITEDQIEEGIDCIRESAFEVLRENKKPISRNHSMKKPVELFA